MQPRRPQKGPAGLGGQLWRGQGCSSPARSTAPPPFLCREQRGAVVWQEGRICAAAASAGALVRAAPCRHPARRVRRFCGEASGTPFLPPQASKPALRLLCAASQRLAAQMDTLDPAVHKYRPPPSLVRPVCGSVSPPFCGLRQEGLQQKSSTNRAHACWAPQRRSPPSGCAQQPKRPSPTWQTRSQRLPAWAPPRRHEGNWAGPILFAQAGGRWAASQGVKARNLNGAGPRKEMGTRFCFAGF